MYQLTYAITCLEPVLLAARHGDANMLGTLDFIPGSSILGLLANRFLHRHQLTSEAASRHALFQRCFLSGEVIYSNACITWQDKDGTLYSGRPVPRAIHQEKNGRKIFDLLCRREPPDDQTKALSGWCHIENNQICFKDVATTINFHHSRNPKTGTPLSGAIFNYEAIAAHQTFQGEIRGPAELLTTIANLSEGLRGCYLGRSKNSEYGRIQFEWLSETPAACMPMEVTEGPLTLTLLSDAIIYNEYGYATTDPSELAKLLGLSHFDKVLMQAGSVETFVGIWGLKKPSDVCFKAGSCFLIQDADKAARKRLADQQLTGIGLRIHEGFGRFVLNWQKESELIEMETTAPAVDRPAGPVPALTRTVIERSLYNLFERRTRVIALKELNRFREASLPSPSLISRLKTMADQLDRPSFINQIERLRRSARDQLEHCHDGAENLFEFLTKRRLLIADVLATPRLDTQEVRQMIELIQFKPDRDANLEALLWKSYSNAFFSGMRRLKIASAG